MGGQHSALEFFSGESFSGPLKPEVCLGRTIKEKRNRAGMSAQQLGALAEIAVEKLEKLERGEVAGLIMPEEILRVVSVLRLNLNTAVKWRRLYAFRQQERHYWLGRMHLSKGGLLSKLKLPGDIEPVIRFGYFLRLEAIKEMCAASSCQARN